MPDRHRTAQQLWADETDRRLFTMIIQAERYEQRDLALSLARVRSFIRNLMHKGDVERTTPKNEESL